MKVFWNAKKLLKMLEKESETMKEGRKELPTLKERIGTIAAKAALAKTHAQDIIDEAQRLLEQASKGTELDPDRDLNQLFDLGSKMESATLDTTDELDEIDWGVFDR